MIDMAPLMKNITQVTAAAPVALKGKWKTIKALSLQTASPTYPMSTSLMLIILIQTLHRYEGCRPLSLNPSSTTNNSFRCFSLCGSSGGPTNRDDPTLRAAAREKKSSNPCPNMIAQANRDMAEVAILL